MKKQKVNKEEYDEYYNITLELVTKKQTRFYFNDTSEHQKNRWSNEKKQDKKSPPNCAKPREVLLNIYDSNKKNRTL